MNKNVKCNNCGKSFTVVGNTLTKIFSEIYCPFCHSNKNKKILVVPKRKK